MRSNRLWYDGTFRSSWWSTCLLERDEASGRDQQHRMAYVGDDIDEVSHTQMILHAALGQAKLVGRLAERRIAWIARSPHRQLRDLLLAHMLGRHDHLLEATLLSGEERQPPIVLNAIDRLGRQSGTACLPA